MLFSKEKNTPHKELFQHYTRVFEVEDITVYTHTSPSNE
jgi:hypothetical protein